MKREVYERPAMPYLAAASFDLSEKDYHRAGRGEVCNKCGGELSSFPDSFYMDAGYGYNWIVSEKSGICKSCFDTLRNSTVPAGEPPVPSRVLFTRWVNGREMTTIEDNFDDFS